MMPGFRGRFPLGALLLPVALALAACAGAAPPGKTVETAATARLPGGESGRAGPAPPAAASAGSGLASGRTQDGYFFLGQAAAPVELWDFSDFL